MLRPGVSLAILFGLSGWLGCGLGDPLDAKLERVLVDTPTGRRAAAVHVPEAVGHEPHPLVIALHGGGPPGSGKGRALARAWQAEFDDGVLFAFPISTRPSGSTWSPEEDLPFLRALIRTIGDRAAVDRRQVYLAGVDAGGSLVWRAACEDTETWAGFAVVHAPLPDDVREQCAPATKRPLVMVGTDTEIEGAAFDWLLENRRCGRFPTAQPWVGPTEARGRGRQHDCWTVRHVERWVVDAVATCFPGRNTCPGVDAAGLIRDYWHRAAGLVASGQGVPE